MKPELDAFWMPFTASRQFKKAPRLLAKSSGMYYWDDKGRQILDGRHHRHPRRGDQGAGARLVPHGGDGPGFSPGAPGDSAVRHDAVCPGVGG